MGTNRIPPGYLLIRVEAVTLYQSLENFNDSNVVELIGIVLN